MAGQIKHGSHKYSLMLPALAAGSAADTEVLWVYDAYAEGAATATGYVYPYDATSEQVIEAQYTVGTTYTGQATNFASVVFGQARAGAVLNELRVTYSAAGVTTAAYTVANLNVASGAVVTNAGTGTLTLQTGAVLPWTLQQGDVLYLRRLSNNVTGQATPGISLTFRVKQFGS